MDYYKQKNKMKTELVKYLLHLQEFPQEFSANKFDKFLSMLASDYGFSVKVIEKELGLLGLRFNRDKGLLEKVVSAYENIEGD